MYRAERNVAAANVSIATCVVAVVLVQGPPGPSFWTLVVGGIYMPRLRAVAEQGARVVTIQRIIDEVALLISFTGDLAFLERTM